MNPRLLLVTGMTSFLAVAVAPSVATAPAPATITIDATKVTHTLPDAFFGVGFGGGYYAEDVKRPDYVALVKELAPEIVRLHMYSRSPGTVAAPTTEMSHLLALSEALVPSGVKLLLQLGAWPRSSSEPVTAIANVDGGDRGPASHAAWVAEYVRRFGTALRSVESYNEPATNAGRWFPTDRQCADWAAVHHRQYYDAVKKVAPAIDHFGAVLATTSNRYGRTEMEIFLAGKITGWPWPDDNTKHVDVVSFHGYQSASAVGGGPTLEYQVELNHAFYPTYDATRGGFLAAARAYRKLLDDRGATSVRLAMTEFGSFGTAGKTAKGALVDAAFAVIAANEQGRLKLDQLDYHAINRNLVRADGSDVPGVGGGDSIILWGPDAKFHKSVRYTVMKELVGPFLHRFKRQLSTKIVATLTPAVSAGDSVPSVQAAAGLSADGRTLGVVVLNIDLSTPRAVTIDLGKPPASDVTGKTMPATQPFDAPLPVIAPFHAGASFVRTIGAGEIELYEIPLVSDVVPDAGPVDADAGAHDSGAPTDAGSAADGGVPDPIADSAPTADASSDANEPGVSCAMRRRTEQADPVALFTLLALVISARSARLRRPKETTL